MNEQELTDAILHVLGFVPTDDQKKATEMFVDFLFSDNLKSIMLLCGSAGTGKTSLASAIVKTLEMMGMKIVLLAPTGRAAKVFSLNSGLAAYTIHRKIYRQRSFEGIDTPFRLGDNKHRNTLFVVDEASMISNESMSSSELFGSGRLLDDLIQYVYATKDCRLMLIGDKCQLPPVGLLASPALSRDVLKRYGLKVMTATLDEVLRQSQDSGILYNATIIRRMTDDVSSLVLPRIRLWGFTDVRVVMGTELIENLCSSYSEVGVDGTIVVTRSNKRANTYNQGIRNQILGRETELCSGDRLMVVKNNYYWTERREQLYADERDDSAEDSLAEMGGAPPNFLANGDVAIVKKVHDEQEVFGFRFADVTLEFPDYDSYELDVKIILNSLSSEAPFLSREEQMQLFAGVMEDYAHLSTKKQRYNAVRQDAYYNALQVKFAYAVTCHKAQGGQWAHVYIDQGYMTDDMFNQDYIHWLYTAFTRATEKLFLVNWQDRQTEQ